MKITTEEEKYFVSLGMRTYGGSFVKALGEALSHADSFNQGKIASTWPEFWDEYLDIGKKLHEKQND